MDTYQSLAIRKRSFPTYLFPFAVDGGGNLFLADCRTDRGAVYIWWHDVLEGNLLDLRTGIGEFWTYLETD